MPRLKSLLSKHLDYIEYRKCGATPRQAALKAGFKSSYAYKAKLTLEKEPLIATKLTEFRELQNKNIEKAVESLPEGNDEFLEQLPLDNEYHPDYHVIMELNEAMWRTSVIAKSAKNDFAKLEALKILIEYHGGFNRIPLPPNPDMFIKLVEKLDIRMLT